jgi:hypothetical protein
MQVLADQQQGLYLALAQQQARERVERVSAPLHRLQCAEWTVVGQDVQQRQQRRDGVLELRIKR